MRRREPNGVRGGRSERPPPEGSEPPDLARELRPRLDEINRQLLDAFARCRPVLATARRRAAFWSQGEKTLIELRLDSKQRAELIAGLLRACEMRFDSERTDERAAL